MMKTGLLKNALRSLVGTKMGLGFDIVPENLSLHSKYLSFVDRGKVKNANKSTMLFLPAKRTGNNS